MNKTKVIATVFVALALACAANAQSNFKIDNQTYDMANLGSVSNLTSYSGSGTLKSFACVVTQAPANMSTLSFGFTFIIDSTYFKSVYIWSNSTTFAAVDSLYGLGGPLPWARTSSSGLPGPNVGDSFVMEMNLPFASSLTILPAAYGSSGSASGKISCSVLRTI